VKGLRLADDLVLPREAVTQTFGILAVRGAGKSNAAAVLAEQMAGAQLPFVVVDPVGTWWQAAGTQIQATAAGIVALGATFEPLPTGHALWEWWRARLPLGERRVLEVLVAAGGVAVEREAVSAETGYKRSSRDTYLQRLAARRLVVAARDGVAATGKLFG